MTSGAKTIVGVVAGLVALFVASIAYKVHAYAALAPGPNDRTFAGFAHAPRGDREFVWMDHDGHRLLVCRGPMPPLLAFPSGPAAYVFDERGDLVDWTPDVGDTPRLSFAQTGGAPVTREAALAALAVKP